MARNMLKNGNVAKVVAKMGSGKRVSCAVSFNELNFMQVICRWFDTPSRPLPEGSCRGGFTVLRTTRRVTYVMLRRLCDRLCADVLRLGGHWDEIVIILKRQRGQRGSCGSCWGPWGDLGGTWGTQGGAQRAKSLFSL